MLASMPRALVAAVFLVATSLLASAPRASAQTEADLERARTLFAEGVELTHEERWDEAVARFRQVLEVRSTPQVQYNLALALERSGELSEAASILREIQDSRELNRQQRRDAARLLNTIGPRLGQLIVRISGDEAGVRVQVGDDEVPLDRIGQPLVVDPGTHRVSMHRRGREVASQQVTVTSGEPSEVTLVEVAVAPEPIPQRAPATEEPAGELNIAEQWWFWVVIGAIVVTGVTIGIVAGTSSSGPSAVSGNLTPGVLEVRF